MKIFSTKTSFEQRKTPRYIYHLTNGYNYKSMLKDGYIIAKKNDEFINNKAVFAFDIQNFINKWGLHKDWYCANDKDTLRTSLLIAICVSAINLFIGLIWGSISGYFGGLQIVPYFGISPFGQKLPLSFELAVQMDFIGRVDDNLQIVNVKTKTHVAGLKFIVKRILPQA